MQHSFNSVTITAICFVLILAALCTLPLHAVPQLLPANAPAVSGNDPDKLSSEMNHHIAGIFLIAIGLSVLWSKHDRSRAWLRWLPPILFISAGLLLAAWSDSEIWPRGDLSWSWLLQHDAEARQHKLYALLLIVFGIVEYVQSTPRLHKPWLRMATPVLCVLGGVALFFHHHGGMVMETAHAMDHSEHEAAIALDKSNHCQSATESMPVVPHHHDDANVSHPCSSTLVQAGTTSTEHNHAHALMGSGANIQRQHVWFAVVGFFIALFKFLHDFARPAGRVSHSLWANGVIALGILLLIYVE